MKLFKQTVAFDFSKVSNKQDYILWEVQARLSLWRIRLGVFGGLFIVILKSYVEFDINNISFLFFSENQIYDYFRIASIIFVGIGYMVCFYSVVINQKQQNVIFKEAISNGNSK